ncbi:MAG: PD40 domain-containing protein [Deltaproteobacteria bacterium]|nr:PD40 domain-containing protein [Deltaproteobacteria bacterium]
MTGQRAILAFFVVITLLPLLARADVKNKRTYISIFAKKILKTPIAIANFVQEGEKETALAFTLRSIVRQDLDFTNYFTFVPPESFLEDPNKQEKIDFTKWRSLKVRFLILGNFTKKEDNLIVTLKMFDTQEEKIIFKKTLEAHEIKQRHLMHLFSNNLVEILTGEKGIFLTKIAFTSDKTGHKELYVMDYDGKNITQLTKRKNYVLLPSWSPDGKKLLFSSYTEHKKNVKNLDLFIFSLETKKTEILSQKTGLNMGGVFTPDGKYVALTLSVRDGYPNIYLHDLEKKEAQIIAQSSESDFSPAFSPDGKKLLFVSTRKGNPHLFIRDLRGPATEAKRLTFAGKYNAKPDWSPAGDKIVFAGQLEGHFDLFSIDAKGYTIERLTKIISEGDNEHPSWSPNGQHLAFYSTRQKKSDIYIITADGSLEKKLTSDFGNCTTPAWSPVNFENF